MRKILPLLLLLAPNAAAQVSLELTTSDGKVAPWSVEHEVPGRQWGRFSHPSGLITGAKLFTTGDEVRHFVLEWTNSNLDPETGATDGPVYYDQLRLKADPGWGVMMSEQRSTSIQGETEVILVKEWADDDHVLLPQRTLVWRGVLYLDGYASKARETLALTDVDWEKKQQLSFGVHGIDSVVVPEQYSFDGARGKEAWARRKSLEWDIHRSYYKTGEAQSGRAGVHLDAMGPAYVLGTHQGWAPGGWGIWPYDDPVPTAVGAQVAYSAASMNAMRMDTSAVFAETGYPIPATAFLKDGKFPFFTHDGVSTDIRIPAFNEWDPKSYNEGNCSYESRVRKLERFDGQHYIRSLIGLQFLISYLDSAWAKEVVEARANHLWMAIPPGIRSVSKNGSLPVIVDWVTSNPHKTGNMDRTWAWRFFTFAFAWQHARDEWRDAASETMQSLFDIANLGTLGNGVPMRRDRQNQNWSGNPWGEGNDEGDFVSRDHDAALAFQINLITHGKWALIKSGYQHSNPSVRAKLAQQIVDCATFMRTRTVPGKWMGKRGTPNYVSVATHNGDLLEEIQTTHGGPELVVALGAHAIAYEITQSIEEKNFLLGLLGLSPESEIEDIRRRLWTSMEAEGRFQPHWIPHAAHAWNQLSVGLPSPEVPPVPEDPKPDPPVEEEPPVPVPDPGRHILISDLHTEFEKYRLRLNTRLRQMGAVGATSEVQHLKRMLLLLTALETDLMADD